MSTPRPDRTTATILLVVAVVLVAANMRPAITAIGPLLGHIQDDTGMAAATLGLITSVPLACWAVISPVAHRLSARFGLMRTVTVALLVLLAGTVVRSLSGPVASLWIGTALIGAALAIGNVLLPAFIKREFTGRVPLMMAVYSSLLGALGAFSSGVAVPLADGLAGGWRTSLLVTGAALLLPAIAVWVWVSRSTRDGAGPAVPHVRGIWTDRTAWAIAAYMGLQSSTFYMIVTWLASISVSTGRSEATAGADVMIYQLISIGGSLGLPFVLRGRWGRWVPTLLPFIGMAAVVGLLLAPGALLLWAGLLGIYSGSSLGMSLTLMAERARDAATAAATSGMAQSVGYLVAAFGPVAFGALHAATDGWSAPLSLLLAVMAGLIVTGIVLARGRFVFDPR